MNIRFLAVIVPLLAVFMLQATDAQSVRIYINPGHGSWGPDDRPYPTIPYPNLSATGRPDTCGFYETNTNLWKCIQMRETLIGMGCDGDNIILSRWNNGPYPYVSGASNATQYNRALSEIRQEVEVGNFDMFISVHSNAEGAAGTENNVNYPLFLYRGKNGNGNEAVAGSYEMAQTIWEPHWEDQVDWISTSSYSRTQPLLRGDVDFYGSGSWTSNNGTSYYGYLGVLKHGVPGLLVEGFYHSYGPARHRALNEDYCRQEGVRIARGIGRYFGLLTEATGYMMGTVKDKSKSLTHDLYKHRSGTKDDYYPINGAMVKLYRGETFVDAYCTDQNYNGVFVFDNLAPASDYYITVKADGYANLERSGPYTVTANETTYPLLYINAGTPSQLGQSDLEPQFTQDYTDVDIPELEGLTVRRMLTHESELIVLAVADDSQHTPTILRIDPATHTVTGRVSTQGLSDASNGSRCYRLSDIAFTADGMLIGCNQEETVYNSTAGTFRVYQWSSLDAAPSLWFTSPDNELRSGRWYNAHVGNSFGYNGTSQHGTLLTTAVTTGSTRQIRYVTYVIRGGAVVPGRTMANYDYDNSGNRPNSSAVAYGEDFQLLASPLRSDHFIIDGSLIAPRELRLNTIDSKAHKEFAPLPTSDLFSTGASTFQHGLRQLLVTPSSTDGSNVGFAMYDISSGTASAEAVATSGNVLTSTTASGTFTCGLSHDAQIDIYLLRGGKLSRFSATMNDVPPEPVGEEKGIFAYDLNRIDNGNGTYTFTFRANNDATAARIIFTDVSSGATVGSINLEDVTTGMNTKTISGDSLPGIEGQQLRWAVELTARPITSIRRLNSTGGDWTYHHATVAVDRSPESDYFGHIYVGELAGLGNASNGIYRYNPAWQRENASPYNGEETFRRNERLAIDSEGRIYVTDFGDTHSGIYIARPNELDQAGCFTQFFAGTRASSGLFTSNGVNTGSSVSGVSITGSGASTRLYAACEDMNQETYLYDLGGHIDENGHLPTSWNEAPQTVHPKTALYVSNVNLVGMDDGGLWLAENLYTSSGNLSNTISSASASDNHPALRYINPDRSDYWTYATNSNLAIDLNGCAGGGFAINNDATVLVIADRDGILNFYDIDWQKDGNGQPKPVLSKKYTFDADAKDSAATSVAAGRVPNGVYQMAFDWGGNLVVAGGSVGI
ncbi:MAG: carboxypeptidase regulatory-like domain-containing protein [Muribaculaceae bacterium]|nr:carboxypeptidase regulatory-like domain-containing protein [Muribaculaceae bacterium]